MNDIASATQIWDHDEEDILDMSEETANTSGCCRGKTWERSSINILDREK